MNLYEVLDLIIDSNDVTVGGGCASAVSGAMAAGLIGMVARLSLEKNGKSYGLKDSEYLSFADELDKLAEELKNGAGEDAAAYLGIKSAYALPKDTEEHKKMRGVAIEEAAVIAAKVPLNNARRAKRVGEIAGKLKGKTNPNAGSDMECGKMLSVMAVKGACLNVEANLPLIKTESLRAPLLKALNELNA